MLRRSERRVYSQNGEDGILSTLIDTIELVGEYPVPRTFVEFGVQDGVERNTRLLQEERGFLGVTMDGSHEDRTPSMNLHERFITAENINYLFRSLDAPRGSNLGVLSIDLDRNDWYVWRAILEAGLVRPVVVVVEYNSSLDPSEALVVPYDSSGQWDGSHFYGASLAALALLGARHGYGLAGCDSSGVNAFFVDLHWRGLGPSGPAALALPEGAAAAFVRAAYVPDEHGQLPPSTAAEHDRRLSVPVSSGGRLVALPCPLNHTGDRTVDRSRGAAALRACAAEFVEAHGLAAGMGCGDAECATAVLAAHLQKRRWLAVGPDGTLVER